MRHSTLRVPMWFLILPPLRKLGVTQLRSACEQWLATPTAREAGVIAIGVSDDLTIVEADVAFDHVTENGEVYHFPLFDLIRFIGETNLSGHDQKELMRCVEIVRKKAGPDHSQRYIVERQLISFPGEMKNSHS